MGRIPQHRRWRWLEQGVRRRSGELGILLGLLVTIAGASAAGSSPDGKALACPSGQITWLRGTATPGSALLARFNGAAVGGGSAGADGTWAIPITVRERPGIYPVVVLGRTDGAVMARFTCYVDLPVGATPTATLTPWPTIVPAIPQPANATPASAQIGTQPTVPAPVTTPTMPATPAMPDRTPTPEPSVTPALAVTDAPAEPSPTAPLPGDTATIVLAVIQADDPADPELFEYAIVENVSPAPYALVGWHLTNQATSELYAIPDVTIPAGELLVIWSGDGPDDPATGTLYWPAPQGRWSPGQTAALVTATGEIVSTLVVSDALIASVSAAHH